MNSHSTHIAAPKAPKRVYVAAFIVLFFSSLSAADSVGFVPCYIDGSMPCGSHSVAITQLPTLGEETASSFELQASSVLPTHISIPAVGIDLPVQNPSTLDIAALDVLLQQGPARYAQSAQLGESGNVLIFAHSSHLPIVHNQMFRAFNRIPELTAGDSITLTGADGTQYLYSVVSVVKATTDSGTTIDLSPTLGSRLTLVTCDTLTGKSARYILTADLIGTL